MGVKGIMKHESEFQNIADANDGTRAASTPGYDASAAYVADKLRRTGFIVTEQSFEFPFFEETGSPTFERLTPSARNLGAQHGLRSYGVLRIWGRTGADRAH